MLLVQNIPTNKNCGTLGDTSVLSFTPHKIITMGQGGMVMTDNYDTYEKLINLIFVFLTLPNHVKSSNLN